MRRLNTLPYGGMPFELDDIRWMQDGWIEAISALVKTFGLSEPYAFILFGCELTDGVTTWDLSAGAAVFNGEICIVPAQSKEKNSAHKFYLQAVEVNEPTGQEVFLNAISEQTYKNTIGQFNSSATPPSLVPLITFVNLSDALVIKRGLPYIDWYAGKGSWIELESSDYSSPFQAAAIPFQFKRRGNMIEFRGEIARSSALSVATNSVMAVMPSGWRPSGLVSIPIKDAPDTGKSYIEFHPNGDIKVRGDISPVTFGTTDGPYIAGSFPLP